MKRTIVGTSVALLGTLTLIGGGAGAVSGQLPPVSTHPDEQVELGRLLFWDPILSGEKDVACATCHHPDFAWADGRALSLGPGASGLGPARSPDDDSGVPVAKRNAQSILNTVYNGTGQRRRGRGRQSGRSVDQASAPMFWDHRTASLEAQALEPIRAFEEMRGSAYSEDVAIDSVLARLRTIPEYVQRFDDAFGAEGIRAETLGEALAAFERSLVAVDSPWDRFQNGDASALSAQQRQGMRDFDAVGCDRCHGGTMFSDFRLHAEGVPENPLLAVPDTGDGRYRFRSPSLRNVALTAPYMHNGTLASLEDVLLFYDRGRSENPNVVAGGRRGGRGGRGGGPTPDGNDTARLDRDFQRVSDMSPRQMENIVAFLGALTDDGFERTVPTEVPSGLPPGGTIGH